MTDPNGASESSDGFDQQKELELQQPPAGGWGGMPEIGSASSPQVLLQAFQYGEGVPLHISMQECESVLPGSAERLLRLHEADVNSRIQQRGQLIDAQIKLAGRGMTAATVISVICVLATVALIAGGYPVGAVLLGIPLVMLVRAFLNRNNSSGDNSAEPESS